MDLRDLRYFETIAELEHVGRAAERLHRSPPALTKCIRRLEDSLGMSLFEHVGRGIRLTAAGQALKRRAKVLQIAMDDTLREIDAVAVGASGHLRIGVAPTIAQYLLPGACRAFLDTAKDVTISTLIGLSRFLRDALHAGEIDMAITVYSPDEGVVAHPIVDDDVVVVAGTHHEIFRRRPTVRDLARYRWVLPIDSYDSEIRHFVDSAFKRHGLSPPSVQIETNSVTLLPNMIAATGLLSFISRRHLGRGHLAAPLREVRLKEMTMRRRFALIYREDAFMSPAGKRFADLLIRKGQALFAKSGPA
jgi:DNA-binding transcriptional LysR family regulator